MVLYTDAYKLVGQPDMAWIERPLGSLIRRHAVTLGRQAIARMVELYLHLLMKIAACLIVPLPESGMQSVAHQFFDQTSIADPKPCRIMHPIIRNLIGSWLWYQNRVKCPRPQNIYWHSCIFAKFTQVLTRFFDACCISRSHYVCTTPCWKYVLQP